MIRNMVLTRVGKITGQRLSELRLLGLLHNVSTRAKTSVGNIIILSGRFLFDGVSILPQLIVTESSQPRWFPPK